MTGGGTVGVWSIVAMYAVTGTPVSTRNRWSLGCRLARRAAGQQSLRKIYPLREFRHLPAQLVHGREQLLALRGGHGWRNRAVSKPLGERLPKRRQRDHPREEAPDGHDGDEDRNDLGPHAISLPAHPVGPRRAAGQAGALRNPPVRPARPCPAAWRATPPGPLLLHRAP